MESVVSIQPNDKKPLVYEEAMYAGFAACFQPVQLMISAYAGRKRKASWIFGAANVCVAFTWIGLNLIYGFLPYLF